jgi:hypothetical protein
MIAGIFFVSAMVVLSLTIYQSASLTWSLPEMKYIDTMKEYQYRSRSYSLHLLRLKRAKVKQSQFP